MKKRKFIPPKPLIVVHHPAGVKVQIPLKDLTEFTKSMCHLYRFHWKAKKTADALERVNRLSMEAMVEWAKVTSPYVALTTSDQGDSQQAQPSDDPQPSRKASGNTDRQSPQPEQTQER